MSRAKPSTRRMVLRRMERTIVTIHRWLGIFACLFFAVWFASGLVMVYVNFPRLTDAEYLERQPAMAWDRVHIGPTQALAEASQRGFPKDLRLEMSGARPVYRVTGWDGRLQSVYADDGAPLTGLSPAQAAQVAARYEPGARPVWKALAERDQWSFPERLNAVRPMHRFALNDAAGTEIYVSDKTGAVVLDSTRSERFWNWLGGIPHLIDVQQVRAHPGLWRGTMLSLTSIGTLIAFSGFYLGIVRLGIRKRYMGNAITPYRGWMKWHHLLGVVGGVFLFAWVASSWLYLRPNHLLERKPTPAAFLMAYAGHSAPDFPASVEALPPPHPEGVQRVRFIWLASAPRVVYEAARRPAVVLDPVSGRSAPLTRDEISKAARALSAEASGMQATLLTAPDEHWHTFGLTFRKLPIVRIEFDDAERTWFHIDPETGEILNTTSQGDRLFRWLFNGLHRFDFLALQRLGVVRDFVVWSLLLAGLTVSVTGVVIGWKHLRKPKRKAKPKRMAATGAPAQTSSTRA
jgi:uncharacterized iron-regulated membrane protein